jgi:ABC-type Na+ efflux pump permease subunit
MGRGIAIILGKEWKYFLGNDRGMYLLYAAIVLLWSFLFVSAEADGGAGSLVLWLLPFSVVVASNFMQAAFVAERISGSIEVLLTCGLSRAEIMLGKMLFVALMTSVMGYVCIGLSSLWAVLARVGGMPLRWSVRGADLALFASAACLNAALGALLSICLPNPRMMHFINFMVVGVVMSVFYWLQPTLGGPHLPLVALLLVLSVLAGLLALRGAQGERISRMLNI